MERKKKKTHSWTFFFLLLLVLSAFVLFFFHVEWTDRDIHSSPLLRRSSSSSSLSLSSPSHVFLSIIILTFNNSLLLSQTLQTLLSPSRPYDPPWQWEVLLIDNACFSSTFDLYKKYDRHSQTHRLKYVPLCNNTRYSDANNVAVAQFASKSSQWLLFLNDDVIPQSLSRKMAFLGNFHRLLEAHGEYGFDNTLQKHPRIGAVGCKLLFSNKRIVEAGSLILSSGKTDNYLRDADACENQARHVRRIHYSSGACLFVRSKAFQEAGGFDGNRYEAYFEDTHLQMHLRHKQRLQILYSPFSQALHVEHGTFGQKDSAKLMDASREKFLSYWSLELKTHPVSAIPVGSKANGALSAHLMSKDDTTLLGNAARPTRCLVAGTAVEVALFARQLVALQEQQEYIITVLVLKYPKGFDDMQIESNCAHNSTLVDLFDAYIRRHFGNNSKKPNSKRFRLYPLVMRMLRLVGIEVLWESSFDDSTPPEDSGSGGNTPNKFCEKDVDGCGCGADFHRNPSLRITLDHLLSERDRYYSNVINIDTGLRPRIVSSSESSFAYDSIDWKGICVGNAPYTHSREKKPSIYSLAPRTALKLKSLAKRYSVINISSEATSFGDVSQYQEFSSFPLFINMEISQLGADDCRDESREVDIPLPDVSCISFGIAAEVLPILRKYDRISSSQTSDASSSRNYHRKFLSLIREKELSERVGRRSVTVIEAGTDEGYFKFAQLRHKRLMDELSCFFHRAAITACSTTHEPDASAGGLGCAMEMTSKQPRVKFSGGRIVSEIYTSPHTPPLHVKPVLYFTPSFSNSQSEASAAVGFDVKDVTEGGDDLELLKRDNEEAVKAIKRIAPRSCKIHDIKYAHWQNRSIKELYHIAETLVS